MYLQDEKTILLLIFFIMLMVPISMVVLFVIFNNKKKQLLQKQVEAQRKFDKELIESHVEIREETLRNISWELHDNIGQLLTLAKIHLQNAGTNQKKIQDSTEILGQALNEVRALSKSINPEHLKRLGMLEASQKELERFERLRFLKTKFNISGTPFEIPETEQVILFRILQEFFSNTIKHARASEIILNFIYDESELTIKCHDNGVGFAKDKEFMGLGLKNMKFRSELINAKFLLTSIPNEGTTLLIKKNYKNET